jgi:acetyltransferase
MGSASVRDSWRTLDALGVPNFEHPDRAVKALEAMFSLTEWQKAAPAQTPAYGFDADAIRRAIADARAKGYRTLSERESRNIAAACGIVLPASTLAPDAEAAVRAAAQIGYPVVVKISSEDILHKSDAGGVKVGLADAQAVRAAFSQVTASALSYKADAVLDGVLVQQMAPEGREVIVGVNRDPQFGPVIMFGLGGVYVEVLKDVVFRVAPLTTADAEDMVRGIRAARILGAFRGSPAADMEALVDVLLRVSQLAVQFPELSECDLNPLRVYPEGQGVMALDVRFGLT